MSIGIIVVDMQQYYLNMIRNSRALISNIEQVLKIAAEKNSYTVFTNFLTRGPVIEQLTRWFDTPIIFTKNHLNPFKFGNLDQILTNQEISELIVMGVKKRACVYSTVKAAHDLGYGIHISPDTMAEGIFTGESKNMEILEPYSTIHPTYHSLIKLIS